ncbi:phosphoenolpyruvate carboxykinase (ATP) [Paenibacillus apiarius]|uniref:Phosphoenolpyruvate carboxykinase (ATP) n=1 Tax=Paenibacillus apiarius TaxID=46240 RepID=A0ABT4DW70_9BACL|nr:phosphoenolpyruvate carboxykinase (ATP) [Paenibacillus apiarius]MCY9513066.1 phosphoenolpyruvate carboxykinase (ATP) [Paenibacillus apiarius]MCY9521576.1 phosphoenolpyruvate carboxykinase (ATP) [Paenibacillus apiarius]MCY9551730.1 phosphoenolpyruvate carboxykinase (ATP) [Paenibacillus apiarius]MCY9560482.1 phosphoenolpyruvate carboxykinase (ATP) [Paenibacillus apiarius]MCY9685268.1 phosphoenolpyruvate carboxykinase (ATP) [Paenibacillus apiarius]
MIANTKGRTQNAGSNVEVSHRNLPVAKLVESALLHGEGQLTSTGALQITTGKYTGRSPKDKFIVREPQSTDHIAWGKVNQALTPEQFDSLYEKTMNYMESRNLFVFNGYAGADQAYRLPIRIINEYAWQNLFVHQLFIRPTAAELQSHEPEFTVIAMPGLKADPATDGTNSETFIVISFERKTVLIGGTHYAGEMKKSIFSVMNYLLPFRGVMPMHCSANVGEAGDTALFFGLSGTGKTTLSADPHRRLIGDDEHGWSDTGVFNFEGGCYAKCIGLTQEKEPQIWNAIRFGSVLENVVIDAVSGEADYRNNELTENSRAAYPIEYIQGSVIPGVAGHPNVIFFLTADAFGVLPPVSKLTKEQAMYHFLSGYTSKLAGTERGVTDPEATFSACFAGPFLPLRPGVYAEMLGDKITKHGARVYLVNTGWSGGPYGIGERMNLSYTRAMITAIMNGSIENASFTPHSVFGMLIPDAIPLVPHELLDPRNVWADKSAYDRQARQLAKLFAQNFEKFSDVSDAIKLAGPQL